MANTVVDITGLSRDCKVYQKDLRMLPYAVLLDVLAAHGINLFPGVQNKDVITYLERQGGIARPYKVGLNIRKANIGKMVESELKVETAYASIVDNIQNYKEKIIITPTDLVGSNVTKTHPFQVTMMMTIIRTFAEDLLYAIFSGKRDTDDLSPFGCFNGFDTILDAAIVAGEVSNAKGNMIDSGSLAAPAAGQTTALDNLIAWLRQADQNLLKSARLLMPKPIYNNLIDCLENKYQYKDADIKALSAYISNKNAGELEIVPSTIMGTGDRIMLVNTGLGESILDFGMNSMGDADYVQLQPTAGGDDPNNFYYWIQGDYGTRIRSFHKKAIMINEGTNVANSLSGDYRS